MAHWELRNQQITSFREALKDSPTDLVRANRYWLALAGDRAKNEADLRSGSDVIEAYRGTALSSKDGAAALASAYRDLFQVSGEAPRSAYFDHHLIVALKARLEELSDSQCSDLEWLLRSIGVWESRQ